MTGGTQRSVKDPAEPAPGRGRPRARRRRIRFAALAALAALLLPAGCSSSEGFDGDKPRSLKEAIRIVPHDGARGVRAGGRFEVEVRTGHLERVEVVRTGDAGRQRVAGRISPDGRVWRPAPGGLAPGVRYTVDVVARDDAGHRAVRHVTFTTSVPPGAFVGVFHPEDRTTVGAGLIVSLEFSRPIADRAAVQRAISVTARPSVEIAPHWFGNRRLDFRPRKHWRSGTDIAVRLRLRGIRGGPHTYGIQSKTVHYHVGRDQTATVDAARHTLTVRRNGRVLATYPVTAGDAKNPTYNGTMVILERRTVTRMNGHTVGFGGAYDIKDVPHAMRLTRSGTFVHGNYWAGARVFGTRNTSHGCVGLRDTRGGGRGTPADRLFRQSIVGDIVQVRHSRGRGPAGTVAPDNGLGGWNMTWQQWKRGSALR
ncbi:L,D-transpeptidase [Streptomyces natalensis]|uniref:L,D-transpeptidase n=1 Tax=Streptomyces natalensis TaxID=68242 RepID=UPI00099C46B5|nr:Ig-like domain-containing protein [Streptomyces natalensis]